MSVVRIAYVAFPLGTLLLALPIIFGVLPYEIESGRYHAVFWVIGGAFLAGVVAAPGYLRAAFCEVEVAEVAAIRKWWIIVSLLLGVVAALVAIPFVWFLFWPLLPLPLGTLVLCIWLRLRCRAVWK